MRVYFIVAAVALQVLVLAVMAGQREYILATGETIYLRTAPIDPRDPFRGDFVRLRYSLSQFDGQQLQPTPEELRRGTAIYALLEPDARNVGMVQGYSLTKPDEGVFLRGRTRHRWWSHYDTPVMVDFGIETYFVQQGRGLEIEERQGRRSTMQIPMEMELAVGSNGTGIIRGHRWSPLGIQLERIEPETTDDNAQQETPPPAPRLRLNLLNASEAPLALAMLPEACAFVLLSANPGAGANWTFPHSPCPTLPPDSSHWQVLQAGALYTVELDFAEPRWHVRDGNSDEAVSIAQLPDARFRLEYRPPAMNGAPPGDVSPWQSPFPSPAFWATGRID